MELLKEEKSELFYLEIALLIFKDHICFVSWLHSILHIARFCGSWLHSHIIIGALLYLIQIQQLGYRKYFRQLAKVRFMLLGNGDNVLIEKVHDGVQAHGAVKVAYCDF